MNRTGRGFAIYADFTDLYGKNITVVRSSMIGPRCVWIQNEVCKETQLGNAHLTVTMARRVIKALQNFVDGKE